MSLPREIEFKYNADKIKLSDFIAFCQKKDPVKVITASGYDHFFSNKKDTDAFGRHRKGEEFNQLTFKRKTNDENNFIRTEHNIDLSLNMTETQVSQFMNEFGYEFQDSIYKNCFIYVYDYYTLVYYIIYDTDLKEKGRFFEIEMSETYLWHHDTQAWDAMLVVERFCKSLGIMPQGRIKRSLYEMFIQKDEK